MRARELARIRVVHHRHDVHLILSRLAKCIAYVFLLVQLKVSRARRAPKLERKRRVPPKRLAPLLDGVDVEIQRLVTIARYPLFPRPLASFEISLLLVRHKSIVRGVPTVVLITFVPRRVLHPLPERGFERRRERGRSPSLDPSFDPERHQARHRHHRDGHHHRPASLARRRRRDASRARRRVVGRVNTHRCLVRFDSIRRASTVSRSTARARRRFCLARDASLRSRARASTARRRVSSARARRARDARRRRRT